MRALKVRANPIRLDGFPKLPIVPALFANGIGKFQQAIA